jgi:hypothetical protein
MYDEATKKSKKMIKIKFKKMTQKVVGGRERNGGETHINSPRQYGEKVTKTHDL